MMLTGKIIAVTGGAGGIGGALARGCSAAGAKVYALDLLSENFQASEDSLGISNVPVDVGNPLEIAGAFDRIQKENGHLDTLVLAAGIQLHGKDAVVGELDIETWNKTIEVNLTGAFLSAKYAIPLLLSAVNSSIIFIGSPTGITMSGAGYTAYAASKAGMMAMSRTIAADYAKHGLRSNVVVPGTTETPLIKELLQDPSKMSQLLSGTPLGRIGQPEDLVGIVKWLASDESRYATGAFFAVDGGLTAR